MAQVLRLLAASLTDEYHPFMALVLFALAVAVGVFGADAIRTDKPIIDIFLIFVGCAVLLSGSFIVDAIDRNGRRVSRELRAVAAAVRSTQGSMSDGVAALRRDGHSSFAGLVD